MSTYLGTNEVVIAASKSSTEALITRVLDSVSGAEPIFNKSKCGLGCSLTIQYGFRDTRLHLESPQIVVDELDLDTTFNFQLSLDFSALYDCLSNVLPLPPRCITICIPWTDICYSKCIDLGSLGFPVSVPLSFALAGLYEPKEEVVAGDDGQPYWHIYPELDAITPFLIDAGRIIERICGAIANELPWPLSAVAGSLCGVFGQVFDVIEDAINQIAVELFKLLFDATGGWVGLQLKFIPVYKLRQNAVPGTKSPAIPALVDSLTSSINGANELDIRFLLLPAT